MSTLDLDPPRIDTSASLASSSSSDHFSSASEGDASRSPIPTTRVERVDDSAAHGEVPGTLAYNLRTHDAVPDEIEIVPEGRRSRSSTLGGRDRALSGSPRPGTPGGSPIPKTVVEKVDFKPSHGEVEGTEAKEIRRADAQPDEVREVSQGRPEVNVDESEEGRQAWFRSMWEGEQQETKDEEEEAANGEDDFGDDFDDFAEGGEDDADFGDFDEAEVPVQSIPEKQQQQTATPPAPDILAGLPPLDFSTPELRRQTMQPYLDAIIQKKPTPDEPSESPPPPEPFLSDRSLSLWQQLVSPPPMQPPNWTRSRIRRLFLVSLGVPIDLDEILPPSKQKRLILPSINLDGTPRQSTTISRLKDGDNPNSSSTSLDSKSGKPKRPRTVKGPPQPPEFDANAAALLAATTKERMMGMEDKELQAHVLLLREVNEQASRVLEFWLERRDEGLKEKEALEGVVGNLVGFVKGRRRG